MKYIPFLFLLFFISCVDHNKKKPVNSSKLEIKTPDFNADSAYKFIEKQVSFGPRVISTKASEKCAIYLKKKLELFGASVDIQTAEITTYDNEKHMLQNIIASYNPELNNRVALFAHWDSRHVADHDSINKESPILGANDGGSGVGVLLEIARAMKAKRTKIGVDIILFDAEDYGQPENSKYPIMQNSWCLGSQYWSKNLHKKGYYAKYGILLDMVGSEGATFRYEGISNYYASNIIDKVWGKAHSLGFTDYFKYQKSPEIMDDHYYVNTITGIPTIDIIEYDPFTENNFNKHWHTHQDDMRNINKNTLKAVGQTIMSVIYSEK